MPYNIRVNINKLKVLFSVLFIVANLFLARTSIALDEIMTGEGDVSVDVIPENPEPYDDVTITLNSYATDLNKAMIQWQSGTNVVLSGYGKTTYSFKASGPNTITVINVVIGIPGTLEKITKRITINPSEVELIWEGVDSYTPPFYRGKSFPTKEGIIKVVAIPNTNAVKQGKGNVTYTWKSGDNTVESASGYNKDSYIFKNSELNDIEKVTVTAESIDNKYRAVNSIEVPISDPEIVFYRKSPTEGVLYNQALGDEAYVAENEEEVTIVAVPYFMAIKGNEDSFSYNWKINGEDIATPSRKTELTVRPAERGGYATIGITFENLNTLYQKAVKEIKLNL